ncbi:helix-turn-helix domain-containing protein [Sporosarcina sp. ANT_H38]|uniref:helix-turn-helix domain-containing protein n=1 Tax=Sporosarcina sp. ANT_H38 TaxID=2597358 RepID=UPI00165D5C92|nr:helix-turn-helix domain-containing protein [Sporosarcina sp. ANT_H38]
MTNKELAEILEIKPQSLNDWLKFKRKIPPARLEQLTTVFNLSKDYFLKDEHEYTEVDRLEVKMSYLKKTNEFIDDPMNRPYKYWVNNKMIRRIAALIENKKLLNRLEMLIDKVGNIGEEDYSIESVEDYNLLEKIDHVLRNKDENKEITSNLRALFKDYKI